MSGTHAEQHAQQRHGGSQAAPQTTPAAPTPGLEAVKALRASDANAASRVVQIIRQYPAERDEIVAWLHQHRGNAFVQQVLAAQGQVERALPEGIELRSVRASVTIPGQRTLEGDWSHTLATQRATQIFVEVSRTGVRVQMSPSLHVDATWPLRNAGIDGAGIDFATGRAFANVYDLSGLGSGMISVRDKISDKITSTLQAGIANSPLAHPGYDPTQDPALDGTLNAVIRNFQQMFAQPAGSQASKPPIEDREIGNLSVGGTAALRGGRFLEDGNGLVIAPGTEVAVDVDGAGNLRDVSATSTPAAALAAANVRAVRLSTSGFEVVAGNAPIARITQLHLQRGGAVVIDHMELLGKAASARRTESGLSLIGALIAIAARDPRAAGGLAHNAQEPQLVDGVTRRLLEQQFTRKVHDMIVQYRTAVPGIDLAALLGIA
ncbi:MAG TPA: hypothetical protein VFQ53_11095 [Kofleriaceae bacterium]|nr:hypothetical protein [Kofleriaceae bacterium]